MADKKIPKKQKKSNKDSSNTLKTRIETLEKELQQSNESHEKIADKNIRLLAEFDNYKRRTQDERSKLLKYAGEGLAKAVLPILDDLHRTLESDGKGKDGSIMEGIQLIVAKLDKTLENQGIIPFDSVGQDFDPELHEALMSEESDKGDNVVLREFEKGFNYNDKILRHAKVVVSKSS